MTLLWRNIFLKIWIILFTYPSFSLKDEAWLIYNISLWIFSSRISWSGETNWLGWSSSNKSNIIIHKDKWGTNPSPPIWTERFLRQGMWIESAQMWGSCTFASLPPTLDEGYIRAVSLMVGCLCFFCAPTLITSSHIRVFNPRHLMRGTVSSFDKRNTRQSLRFMNPWTCASVVLRVWASRGGCGVLDLRTRAVNRMQKRYTVDGQLIEWWWPSLDGLRSDHPLCWPHHPSWKRVVPRA